jgi:hypothetical protein
VGRQSAFQVYLNKLPEGKRQEVEKVARSAATSSQAFRELKRLYRFRGSYDQLLSWRKAQQDASTPAKRVEVVEEGSMVDDPIAEVKALHSRMTRYCNQLLDLLERHQWIEPGEVRLSSRQSEKLLAALPTISKSCTSTLIELSRLQTQRNERELALATLAEAGEDWRRTLEPDNPELVGLFATVITVTRSRLELDKMSALDEVLQESEVNS